MPQMFNVNACDQAAQQPLRVWHLDSCVMSVAATTLPASVWTRGTHTNIHMWKHSQSRHLFSVCLWTCWGFFSPFSPFYTYKHLCVHSQSPPPPPPNFIYIHWGLEKFQQRTWPPELHNFIHIALSCSRFCSLFAAWDWFFPTCVMLFRGWNVWASHQHLGRAVRIDSSSIHAGKNTEGEAHLVETSHQQSVSYCANIFNPNSRCFGC